MATFSAKDPSERIMLSFDYSKVSSSAPANPVVSISRKSGEGTSDVSLMLAGAPQVVGNSVLQLVELGDDGDDYTIRCVAECGSEKLVVAAILPVRLFDGR